MLNVGLLQRLGPLTKAELATKAGSIEELHVGGHHCAGAFALCRKPK